ncbi:MAG: translation initiation factor IF-3 [Gammaproteobacteria bacterium]
MKKTAEKRLLSIRDLNASEVRLLGAEGEQIGVVSVAAAEATLQEALETTGKDLDLVVISPTATPPVCRIMDKGKYFYEMNKKAQLARKKQKQIQIKEIKLRPVTEEGDFLVKLNNVKRFLEHGDKVKITVRFRGRELSHNELGMEVMKRMEKELGDLITVEQAAKMEGRQLVMMVGPKKKK